MNSLRLASELPVYRYQYVPPPLVIINRSRAENQQASCHVPPRCYSSLAEHGAIMGDDKDEFPKVQGGGSLILAWQIKRKKVLVVGGGEVSSSLDPFMICHVGFFFVLFLFLLD